MDTINSNSVPSNTRGGFLDQGNSPVMGIVAPNGSPAREYLSGTTERAPQQSPIWEWNQYDFLLNSYFGLGGFMDGTYLVPSTIESKDEYLERRRRSHYSNFVKPIIDATYTPVFSEPCKSITMVNGVEDKDGKLVPFWGGFQKNANNRGDDFDSFTEKIVRYSRFLGVSFIVVDNFPGVTGMNKAVALAQRKYPFVQMRLPNQVEESLLVINDFCEIDEITFKERSVLIGDKWEDRWKKWTRNYSVKMRFNDKDQKFEEIVGTQVVYSLGKVPVIPIFSTECESDTVLPHPNFYDLARTCWALYNYESARTRLTFMQMFAILCASKIEGGFLSSPAKGLELPANNSATGNSYPLPFYLSPPPGPYAEIGECIKWFVENLYRLAGQEGVQGVQKQTSGIARSYDFSAKEEVLKKSALMAKTAKEKTAEIFKLYVLDEVFDFEAQYRSNFQPSNDAEIETRQGAYLEKVTTVSTPYSPLVGSILKEYTLQVNKGKKEDEVKKITDWIDENTSWEKQEGEKVPTKEELAAEAERLKEEALKNQ
jgi:hypothetical protein